MKREITVRLLGLIVLSGVLALPLHAQTMGETRTPTAPPKPKIVIKNKIKPTPRVNPLRVRPVVIQNAPTAPQVVTILHKLNGLKLFRLLVRSNELAAIANLDKAFQVEAEIHTNVIAGLALDDGRTIAVWLPEAEAEMPPVPFPFASGSASGTTAFSRSASAGEEHTGAESHRFRQDADGDSRTSSWSFSGDVSACRSQSCHPGWKATHGPLCRARRTDRPLGDYFG